MIHGPIVAIYWTNVEHGVLFTNSRGVFYEQKMAAPVLIWTRLNIVMSLRVFDD